MKNSWTGGGDGFDPEAFSVDEVNRRTKPSPESNEPGIFLREIGLTLWKDADPDIPILKQVKAEYARLL